MSDLRSKLIRLAHQNPELRADILPLLKEAAVDADNFATWMKTYEEQLKQTVQKYPEEYAYGVDEVPAVVKKMGVAFEKGTYNHDGKAIKATCRALGIKHTRTAIKDYLNGSGKSADKKAGSNDVIEAILPMDDMAKLYHKLEKQDEQSAKLLMEVYDALRARLKLSDGENAAMSRVRGMVTRGQNWDPSLLRNNIFKAADALGMKLPSMMF